MTHPITEEQARADLAQLEPIMEIEDRTMSEHDKKLLLELMQGKITREQVIDAVARDVASRTER
ncbi:hypothetical protein [Rhodococcus sp. NPDC058481]|uniref:hypothetical protein n=1 Tax=unclassified Rhodococcus (in: high G+C Gram-positive bacteria) TaxID=192944 RepID=UPI003659BA78